MPSLSMMISFKCYQNYKSIKYLLFVLFCVVNTNVTIASCGPQNIDFPVTYFPFDFLDVKGYFVIDEDFHMYPRFVKADKTLMETQMNQYMDRTKLDIQRKFDLIHEKNHKESYCSGHPQAVTKLTEQYCLQEEFFMQIRELKKNMFESFDKNMNNEFYFSVNHTNRNY